MSCNPLTVSVSKFPLFTGSAFGRVLGCWRSRAHQPGMAIVIWQRPWLVVLSQLKHWNIVLSNFNFGLSDCKPWSQPCTSNFNIILKRLENKPCLNNHQLLTFSGSLWLFLFLISASCWIFSESLKKPYQKVCRLFWTGSIYRHLLTHGRHQFGSQSWLFHLMFMLPCVILEASKHTKWSMSLSLIKITLVSCI